MIMAVMKGIMGARYGTVMTLHYNSALDFIKGKQLETEMKICAVVLKRSRPGGGGGGGGGERERLEIFIKRILLHGSES